MTHIPEVVKARPLSQGVVSMRELREKVTHKHLLLLFVVVGSFSILASC